MNNLFTWGYYAGSESRTIFVIAETELEARSIVEKKYSNTDQWPFISKVINNDGSLHKKGATFIFTGPTFLAM